MTDPAPRRSAMTPLRAGVLVGLGMLLGFLVAELRDPVPTFPASLFAQESGEPVIHEGGEYLYFTFRRNLWVVHPPSGQVRFFMFPDGREQGLVRSRIHRVDPELFPPDQTHYQLSERNLTNFLWILNPTTGKARYLRAGRDGVFDASEVQSVNFDG